VNPATSNSGRLTDYKVTATGSPTTETFLTVPGIVDGVLNETDLPEATALFVAAHYTRYMSIDRMKFRGKASHTRCGPLLGT
jgi:hypothetical protein